MKLGVQSNVPVPLPLSINVAPAGRAEVEKVGMVASGSVAEMTKARLFFQTIILPPEIPDFIPQENYTNEEKITKINTLDFPRMMFIETRLKNDHSNWWVANNAAVLSLLRNAGLKIITKLEKELYVCEPDNPFGKKVFQKLVFPKYGKKGIGRVLP